MDARGVSQSGAGAAECRPRGGNGILGRDMIDRIISRQLPRRSDRTKDLYVALIRAVFRMAMRERDWLEHAPAFKTYMKAGKIRGRYLTQDQAKARRDRTAFHQREVALFSPSTGLRRGNLLKLTWSRWT